MVLANNDRYMWLSSSKACLNSRIASASLPSRRSRNPMSSCARASLGSSFTAASMGVDASFQRCVDIKKDPSSARVSARVKAREGKLFSSA